MWDLIRQLSRSIMGEPWLILGDFIEVLHDDERQVGGSIRRGFRGL